MGLDDHRHVGGDLVVAGAAGVELAGQRPDLLAEQPLDRHVDVLVGALEGKPCSDMRARTRSRPASISASSRLEERPDPEQTASVGL